MSFDPIDPPDSFGASPSHSAAARAGETVYLSGVTAVGADGAMRNPGNIRLQTKHVLEAIATVLDAAGATIADVVMTHVLLRYRGDLAAFEEVYAEAFPDTKPARQVQIAEPLAAEALVEIACVAHLG